MIVPNRFFLSFPFLPLFALIAVSWCSLHPCAAQSTDLSMGARSEAMAQSNVTMADEWSLFNNVGGISGVSEGVVFFGYRRFFDIEGFDKVAAGLVHPLKVGALGVSVVKFGDDLFSEQQLSASYGNKLGFVRLGIRASYYQMRIEDFGTANAFMVDLGAIVELVPRLSFATYISNFTVSKLNDGDGTKLPVLMKAGLSYRPTDDIRFNLDIHKDVEYDAQLKAGLEYRIIEKFFVRMGVNSDPFRACFGGGMKFGRFQIDYAATSHRFLGLAHQASVAFRYQKDE
jgi:hypothetical protein